MSEGLTEDVVVALSRAFPRQGSASQVVSEAGLRPEIQPAWVDGTNADEWWRSVASKIDHGAVENGATRLLEAAQRRFPDNAAFSSGSTPGSALGWESRTSSPYSRRRILALAGGLIVAGGGTAAGILSSRKDNKGEGVDLAASAPSSLIWQGYLEPAAVLSGSGGTVYAVAFDRAGQRLAAANENGTIDVWRIRSREVEKTLSGFGGPVYAAQFGRSDEVLIGGGADRIIRVWNSSDYTPIRSLPSHPNSISSISFSPNGELMASSENGDLLRMWRTDSFATVFDKRDPPGIQAWTTCFDSEGRNLAAGYYDNLVRILDAASGEPLHVLPGHRSDVNSVAYAPGGGPLASASNDGTIKLWETTGYTQIGRDLTGHEGPVQGLSFQPNGRMLASIGKTDRSLILWSMSDGRQLAKSKKHDDDPLTVSFSPAGNLVATSGKDHKIILWTF